MKNDTKSKSFLPSRILQEKCPQCGQSDVFKKNAKLFAVPEMNIRCKHCNYSFDREPGYFIGAMYISYGIAVFFCILTFLVFHFGFPSLPLIYTPIAIIAMMVLIAKKNFKISRIIYIHIFPW